MIYFLSVLQLIFLLISASSEQCRDRNVVQVLGRRKESSQNGYYYGLISTPKYPQEFRTPFNQSWVIDASHLSNETQINVYLTQMYLREGVQFFQRHTIKGCDPGHPLTLHGPRQECTEARDQQDTEITSKDLHDVMKISTSCPYLEIRVNVPSLYGSHYRTKDPFLFHVYGFNITFEVVPSKLGIRNNSCSLRNCSNLGHCLLQENWRDFYCDCVKDHPGRYCGVSQEHCDPEKNVTFCYNGGKCRMHGSNNGFCDCTGTGFSGPKCERKEQPKVSAMTGCSQQNDCPTEGSSEPMCSSENFNIPCSCSPSPRHRKNISKDWRKYEATISLPKNFTHHQNQSYVELVEGEMKENLRDWFNANNLSTLENVTMRFYSPHEDLHRHELQVHFLGPFSKQSEVRLVLERWVHNNNFYRKVPLLSNTLVVSIMPRVKYKSIQISKQTRLKIGKTVSLSCTAITGSSEYFSSNISFRWFKDGLPVNTSMSTSRHMSIGKVPTIDGETTSLLMIDQVSAFDGGLYTCEITDPEFGDQVCGSKEVEVTLPPQIEVEPMSLTLEKEKMDKSVVITCTDGSYSAYNLHNKSIEFVWFRSGSSKAVVNDDVVVLEDIIPQGKILRILRAEQSDSFTCTGFNKEGEERSKTVEVQVLDSPNSPSCYQHWERFVKPSEIRLLWEWTAPNAVAMVPCPKSFSGYVQRRCIPTSDGKARWGRSDFSRCLSDQLKQINSTLQNVKRGFGVWNTSNAGTLMGQVETYMNDNPLLYSGEGEKIISILEDIVKYAFDIGGADALFPEFFRTIVKLLKIPNSCVQEKSVFALCQLVAEMAVRGAMKGLASPVTATSRIVKSNSDVLILQALAISSEESYHEHSYIFPMQDELQEKLWVKDQLRVNFPLDSTGWDPDFPWFYSLTIAAYKNLSMILAPNDFTTRSNKNYRNPIELISPIVQISVSDHYFPPPNSHIKIHFNLSKEHRSLLNLSPMTDITTQKGTHFSCGALDKSDVSVKAGQGRLHWHRKVCTTVIKHESFVECQCPSKSGIFGLLKATSFEDELPLVTDDISGIIIAGFSFCILSCLLSAITLCIYLKCRISLNTLYTLKLLDCIFILGAAFIVLIGRTQMHSSSWLLWSASACSCLIASLSIQVTKALRVLLMEGKPDMPGFIFPWLRNVSQITLLSAIIFSTVLPVWTGTVATLIGHDDTSNESAFKETSYVFAIFVGTMGLVVLVFLGIYYRAVLKTKGELHGYQEQNTCSVSSTFTSDMVWVLTYRMKTLNRSLCLALVLLVMTLGIILNENIQSSIIIQYFLGLSAAAMGSVVFLSYVTHCEYPLTVSVCNRGHSEKPFKRDPEKDNHGERNDGSQRKLYAISSETTGNGSIVGTTGLLPPPPPVLGRHLDDSETQSNSTVEEQSMDTFSTDISFRAPPTHKVAGNRSSRSHRSGSNNTFYSSESSYRSRRNQGAYSLEVVPCLLNTGDYILPSNQNTTRSERSTIPESLSSSHSSGSIYNNYLPIHDHDEIQKKISRDLNILLQD